MANINPILLDFPDHFETERLLIRAPCAGDGLAINQAVAESINELRPWMPWARTMQTLAESETFARTMAAHFILRDSLTLLLFRKADGLFVGSSGLHAIDWTVPRFEIGYWARTSLQGQGYITESTRAITAFAFDMLKAERVEIRCDARNRRSIAVAERAGYKLDGRLRADSLNTIGGRLRDTLIYGLIRKQYQAWTTPPG